MRAKLRAKGTVLRMTKKRLMKLALSHAKKENIAKLEESFKGMPAMIFTKENPFKLYMELQKTKSRAAAKAGQEAPNDIIVPAGPTTFTPGPIIGQLGKYGIKTGVEGGKLVIKQDSVAVKKGGKIDAELAGILTRLGIEPMEIGLNLISVYEEGTIFSSDVLHVDEKEYLGKIVTAYNEAFNVAVYTAYPTAETVPVLLSKASREAKSLAVSQGILNPDTAAEILSMANYQMIALSNSLPDEALSEELKGKKNSAESNHAVQEEIAHEEKPDKEEPKQDAAAGLGSLFG